MDETFQLFLNDIPVESQGFVLELDQLLTAKGSKRTTALLWMESSTKNARTPHSFTH